MSRIVVADDNRFLRRIIVDMLEGAGFTVVGVAEDGDEALALCERHRPDAMTLDLAMPGKDGIAVLRELEGSVPTVVVSGLSHRAVEALTEGAFDLVAKDGDFCEELVAKLHEAIATRAAGHAPAATNGRVTLERVAGAKVVVIATSTGGPKALADVVPGLPSPLGHGTLIVQHMPHGFTGLLAERLDKASALAVREAKGGETLSPGTALVAPGGHHLRLTTGRLVDVSDETKIGGLAPRADLTISDAARLYGERVVLAVLTGMGRDGLEGAAAVRRAGGRVLAEDASTCVVYGMPRAVAEAGLADDVVPLPDMAAAIAEAAA